MANFDIKKLVGTGRPQTTRRVEIPKTIKFQEINGATGLANTDTVTFVTTPHGFIFEDIHPVLIAAEGTAATIDIGVAGDMDGLVDGGNLNGTAGAAMAKAGTETTKPGTPLGEKDIVITVNAAAKTAVLSVVLIGYITDAV